MYLGIVRVVFFQISNKVIDEWRSEKIKAFFNAGLLEMLNSTEKNAALIFHGFLFNEFLVTHQEYFH